MNNEKICYVINFYFGERRNTVDLYNADKLCFLKKQVEVMESIYSPSIGKIVFSFNLEPEHRHYMTEVRKIVPDFIQGAETEIIERENWGMSYAAWSEIFEKYRDSYGYYIFNEDDYFFVHDEWDIWMKEKFNSLDKCGYLCGLVRESEEWNGNRPHAGHATGISSSKVLMEVFKKHGCLPHSKKKDYESTENEGQIGQTYSIVELGYKLYDIRSNFRLQFSRISPPNYDMERFFWWNDKDLLVPAQIVWNIPHVWWMPSAEQYQRHEI